MSKELPNASKARARSSSILRMARYKPSGSFSSAKTRLPGSTPHVFSSSGKYLPAGEVDYPALPAAGTLLPLQSGVEENKNLQQLITRWAEDHGYEVVVETPVSDGPLSVDVFTKAGSTPVACEISVATGAGQQAATAQQCLAAVYGHVLMIAPNKEALERVKAAVEAGPHLNRRKLVRAALPEQAFAADAPSEVRTAPPARVADDSNRLLTAREVEELLRIDVKTVYSYVQKGLMPYVKIQSNVRFIRSEILKWLEERQFKPGGRGTRK